MTKRSYSIVLEGAVALILVASPLAFGSVRPWAYKAVSSAIYALVFLWALRVLSKGGFSYLRTPLMYFIPLFAAVAVLQFIPLPAFVVEAVSPGRASLRQAAGLSGGLDTFALYPWAAEGRAAFQFAVLLFFFLVANYLTTARSITRIRFIALGTGVFIAVMLFIQKATVAGSSTLPFINRNHFAGYMEVLIPFAAAYMAYVSSAGTGHEMGIKKRLMDLFSGPSAFIMTVTAAAVLVLSSSVVLTVSRGGIIGMLFSFVVLGALQARQPKNALRLLVVFGMLLVLALGLAYQDKLGRRMKSLSEVSDDFSASARMEVWRDTAGMVMEFPLTGSGLGGFETAYPFYKTIKRDYHIFQPESDYLYVLAETGVLGFALVGVFLFIYVRTLVTRFYSRRDRFVLGLSAGALAALSALLFHGLVDTGLHMPAILVTLAVLMGLAFSAVHRPFSQNSKARTELFGEVIIRGRPHAVAAVSGCAVVALVLSVTTAFGAVADFGYSSAMRVRGRILNSVSAPTREYKRLVSMLERVSRLEPSSSEYSFEKGRAYYLMAEYSASLVAMGEDTEGLPSPHDYYEKSLSAFMEAVDNNPYSSYAHLMAGRILELGLGRDEEGELEYMKAERLNPTKPFVKLYLSEYYKDKGDPERADEYQKMLPYLDPRYNPVEVFSLEPVGGYEAKTGDTVVWRAEAFVPAGGLEYMFRIWKPNVGIVSERPFGPGKSWNWDTTGLTAGKYYAGVWVRNSGEKSRGVRFLSKKSFVISDDQQFKTD